MLFVCFFFTAAALAGNGAFFTLSMSLHVSQEPKASPLPLPPPLLCTESNCVEMQFIQGSDVMECGVTVSSFTSSVLL